MSRAETLLLPAYRHSVDIILLELHADHLL